jgi:hypothetical protein
MFHNARIRRRGLLALLLAAGLLPPVLAQSAQTRFHEAYYLEHSRRDHAAAARLYREVTADRSAEQSLKSEAKTRLAACEEEIATADFARLMPPQALAYIEINRPGQQLERLFKQLGLLGSEGAPPASSDGENRLAISPALIRTLLGVRGIAVAITGFDPSHERPTGVAIIHAGDVEALRGLYETALPAGGRPVEPIEGCATYDIDGQALVTFTSRLLIAASQRDLIEGVLRRLRGQESDSLATEPALSDALKGREDALLFFCVNAKPMMPLLNMGLAAAGTQSRELAIAQTLLDLNSLQGLTGRGGVSDDGLFLDITLRLDSGHRNLVFNFFRMPPITADVLKVVPAGAAGFVAGALNDADSRYAAAPPDEKGAPPVVTWMDIGREVFANVVSFAAFALPPDTAGEKKGAPIPDVALVMQVHDADHSRALWTQFLGVGSVAAAGGPAEGASAKVEGLETRSFRFPDGLTIHFATAGKDVVLATSRSALGRAVAAKRDGKSIVSDPAFSKSLARLAPDSSFALFLHPARCIELVRAHLDEDDLKEAEQVVATMKDTVASLVISHGRERFNFSAMVTGIPDISGLVAQAISEGRGEMNRHVAIHEGLRREEAAKAALAEARDREAAARLAAETFTARRGDSRDAGDARNADDEPRSTRAIEQPPSPAADSAEREAPQPAAADGQPADVDGLWRKLQALAADASRRDHARRTAEALLKAAGDDPDELNNYAWALLTDERFKNRNAALALLLSQKSNELTGHKNWMFVDTLALAYFQKGDVKAAVELERKALELVGKNRRRGEVEEALRRFEAALKQQSDNAR